MVQFLSKLVLVDEINVSLHHIGLRTEPCRSRCNKITDRWDNVEVITEPKRKQPKNSTEVSETMCWYKENVFYDFKLLVFYDRYYSEVFSVIQLSLHIRV